MEKVIRIEEIASVKVKLVELNIIQYDGDWRKWG